MLVTLFRAAILYTLVIVCVRLMGKRQIGELQPVDLVITVLISEVAAIPMQQNDLPILNSIVAVILLVAVEIFISAICLKSMRFRRAVQGHCAIVIRDGIIDQKQLRKLRMTVNDLIDALRQKDVFSLDKVSYAIVETNGKISVLLKPYCSPLTAADAGLRTADSGMPFVVICDGKAVDSAIRDSGSDINQIGKIIKKQKLRMEDIFIMTLNKAGQAIIVKKEDSD